MENTEETLDLSTEHLQFASLLVRVNGNLVRYDKIYKPEDELHDDFINLVHEYLEAKSQHSVFVRCINENAMFYKVDLSWYNESGFLIECLYRGELAVEFNESIHRL